MEVSVLAEVLGLRINTVTQAVSPVLRAEESLLNAVSDPGRMTLCGQLCSGTPILRFILPFTIHTVLSVMQFF